MNPLKHLKEIQVTSHDWLGFDDYRTVEKFDSALRHTETASVGAKVRTIHKIDLDYGRKKSEGGLRTYLPKDIGKGYWDIIKLLPGIYISITDANYYESHNLILPAEQLLKFRIICSGSLLLFPGEVELSKGSCTIQSMQSNSASNITIQPNLPLRMVIIHALPGALEDFGIMENMLPEEIRFSTQSLKKTTTSLSLASSAKMIRIAQEIIDSRDRLPVELRSIYIKTKAQELLCEVIIRTKPSFNMLVTGNRIRKLDIPRFHEVKRILINNLELSPTIEQLSRLVGINRTKLKAGFSELYGETIQAYRTRVRLIEARRLIEESELSMAEIGKRIGFKYAANFTQLIKKHYGVRPLELRSRNCGSNDSSNEHQQAPASASTVISSSAPPIA